MIEMVSSRKVELYIFTASEYIKVVENTVTANADIFVDFIVGIMKG